MCCWHSLWLRCVSSKAVCHSLVTQGELLISQERDVLASALGSFEDKQLARATNTTYAEKFLRETLRLHFTPHPHPSHRAYHPAVSPSHAWCAAPLCAEPRPLVNPVTSRSALWSRRWKQSCDVRVPLWKSYVLKLNLGIPPRTRTLSSPHRLEFKWAVAPSKLQADYDAAELQASLLMQSR